MTLAFYRGPGDLITKIIQCVTRGPYSHTELIFTDGLVFGSSGRRPECGVYLKRKQHDPELWDFVELEVTPQQEKLLRFYCRAFLGQRFDWRGMASFLFPFLGRNPGKQYCTRLLVKVLSDCGVLAGLPEAVSPNALYALLRQEA